jgi:hypothetical protein
MIIVKKVVGVLTCLMMLTTVALASPLMEYAEDSGSVDLTWRNTENTLSAPGLSSTLPKKSSLDAALTFGIGDNLGFQYRYFAPKSPDDSTQRAPAVVNARLTTREFNLLSKLDKNVTVFGGLVMAKGNQSVVAPAAFSESVDSKSRNLWQVGFIGTAPIAEKTILWGSAGTGRDLINWEVGIGYRVTTDLELNLSYRSIKADNLDFNGGKVDVEGKGLGFGVTVRY